MRLIYTPEDGEKREWLFAPMHLMTPESEAIEEVGGALWDNYDDFGVKFMNGNRRAYRAALWIMLRRENPSLRFAELSVRADEIDIDFDDAEQARIREVMLADPDIDDQERERLLAEIRGEAPDPKAEPDDVAPTDSTSPQLA